MSQEIIRYTIERWDSVIPQGKSTPNPMIYVKADDLLKNKERQEVAVRLVDTGCIYDGLMTTAVVFNSGEYPVLRPNFFEQTGLYVIVLDMPWQRYPPANGSVDILLQKVDEGVKEGFMEPYFPRKKAPCINIEDEEEEGEVGLDSRSIGLMLIGIVTVFIILYWISIDGKQL